MHRVHLTVSGTGEGKVIRRPAFATSVYAPHNDMTMTVEKGKGTRSGFHRENVSFALDNFYGTIGEPPEPMDYVLSLR